MCVSQKCTSCSLALPSFATTGTSIAGLVGVTDVITSVSSLVWCHLMEERDGEITKWLELSKY